MQKIQVVKLTVAELKIKFTNWLQFCFFGGGWRLLLFFLFSVQLTPFNLAAEVTVTSAALCAMNFLPRCWLACIFFLCTFEPANNQHLSLFTLTIMASGSRQPSFGFQNFVALEHEARPLAATVYY